MPPNTQTKPRFPLGQIVMTPGVAALGIDLWPYIRRHQCGDWGKTLDEFDRRQNDAAVTNGQRILSAYDVPQSDGGPVRIWLITEHDRSITTALLPEEF